MTSFVPQAVMTLVLLTTQIECTLFNQLTSYPDPFLAEKFSPASYQPTSNHQNEAQSQPPQQQPPQPPQPPQAPQAPQPPQPPQNQQLQEFSASQNPPPQNPPPQQFSESSSYLPNHQQPPQELQPPQLPQFNLSPFIPNQQQPQPPQKPQPPNSQPPPQPQQNQPPQQFGAPSPFIPNYHQQPQQPQQSQNSQPPPPSPHNQQSNLFSDLTHLHSNQQQLQRLHHHHHQQQQQQQQPQQQPQPQPPRTHSPSSSYQQPQYNPYSQVQPSQPPQPQQPQSHHQQQQQLHHHQQQQQQLHHYQQQQQQQQPPHQYRPSSFQLSPKQERQQRRQYLQQKLRQIIALKPQRPQQQQQLPQRLQRPQMPRQPQPQYYGNTYPAPAPSPRQQQSPFLDSFASAMPGASSNSVSTRPLDTVMPAYQPPPQPPQQQPPSPFYGQPPPQQQSMTVSLANQFSGGPPKSTNQNSVSVFHEGTGGGPIYNHGSQHTGSGNGGAGAHTPRPQNSLGPTGLPDLLSPSYPSSSSLLPQKQPSLSKSLPQLPSILSTIGAAAAGGVGAGAGSVGAGGIGGGVGGIIPPASALPGGAGSKSKNAPMTVAMKQMATRWASQMGYKAYYEAHGCVDPTITLKGASARTAGFAMMLGCQTKEAQQSCQMAQMAQGGAQAARQRLMMGTVLPKHMTTMFEHCLTPGTLMNGMSGMLGSGYSGLAPPPGASLTHKPDCTMVSQMLMMSPSAAEGMFSPESMENIGALRNKYMPMTCQENLIFGSLPYRLCCPGKVKTPTMQEAVMMKSMGAGA